METHGTGIHFTIFDFELKSVTLSKNALGKFGSECQ